MFVRNTPTPYDPADLAARPLFLEAAQGGFWQWRKTFVLKDDQEKLYLISLNMFERIYASLAEIFGKDYLSSTFAEKKVVHQVSGSALDLLVYNTARPWLLARQAESAEAPLEAIYRKISIWTWFGPDNTDPSYTETMAEILKENPDELWWKEGAEGGGSTPQNELILKGPFGECFLDRNIPVPPGVALDIGCGNSASAIYLLERGWTVICIDCSQRALNAMERRANKINREWLENEKLKLVCQNIVSYEWPKDINLVVASSALPCFPPLKMKTIMQNIYQGLKVGGRFIGNFFVEPGNPKEFSRDGATWWLRDMEEAGFLLAGHGYEVLACELGKEKRPPSALFAAEKRQSN